jgi:hypothetical protein
MRLHHLWAHIAFIPVARPHLAEAVCTTGCIGVAATHTADAITSPALQVTLQPVALQSAAPSVTTRSPAA